MRPLTAYEKFRILDADGREIAEYTEWRYAKARLEHTPGGKVEGFYPVGMGTWEYLESGPLWAEQKVICKCGHDPCIPSCHAGWHPDD